MRVLVCGGRDFADFPLVCQTLFVVDDRHGITSILQGGAAGADRLAKRWALDVAGIPCLQMDAPWNKHRKAAGPIRNAWMLTEGKPSIVVAFPGGRGTADMVRRAKAANLDVIEIEP